MRLEFWFDFSCPYAYLASLRIRSIAAAHPVPLSYRPMLLGGVFRGIGAGDGPMATLGPAKAAHTLRDQHRWAEWFAAPFRMPAAHPMRTVRALRGLLTMPEALWPSVIDATYAAYWRDGRDITQDAVLRAVWAEAGADAAQIERASAGNDDAAIKDDLHRRTAEAIELGIFGAPACVVRRDDRAPILLWGQDRLHWLELVLAGWDPDVGAPPGGPRVVVATPPPADAAPQRLDFYFDVASPFAYLGLHAIAAMCRATGTTLQLRPILLGALFRDIGTTNVPIFSFPPPKRAYVMKEMPWWSHWWGVPFAFPKKFPQRTITAQRVCLLAARRSTELGLQVAQALGRLFWADGGDLEDDAAIASALAAVGAPTELVAESKQQASKDALATATAEAVQRGVFGVPTCVITRGDGHDERLYWGQDRFDLVGHALSGHWPKQ